MRKLIIAVVIFMFAFQPVVKADEGMWLPFLVKRLNYVDMQKEGLQLTAEEIYSVNHSSLKDAIIIFGRGCTGEMISDKGLILTNHHCGYPHIQSHSSVEHDYLTDGFWAQSYEEELPNPGLTAKFLVRIEDVSEKINSELNDSMGEEDRDAKIDELSKVIEEEAEKDNGYNASVRSFFKGNEFYLFVYETYTDVRMVGAPPSSIGNFGGDTDNWMWPRHTDDFSMFRVYADADGRPAEYSEKNVPLKPKHHLPVSIAGVEEGDFSMIMGYPGGTERYLTSDGINIAVEKKNPSIVHIRDLKLKTMKKYMDASDEVRIKYASKYAQTANYWKYFQGQTKGLKRLKVADKKKKIEDDVEAWVAKDASRKEKYGSAVENIAAAYSIQENTILSNVYFREAIYRGSEILGFSMNFYRLHDMLEEEVDQEKIDARVERIKAKLDAYFKDYHRALDVEMLGAMMGLYYDNVPQNQHPEILTDYHKKFKGDFNAAAEYVFKKSNLSSKEDVLELLDNPKERKIRKDKAFELATAFYSHYMSFAKESAKGDDLMQKGYRNFVAALREMNPDKKYYPDANFTMRLTYGKVGGYQAADAVKYSYFTTLKGVMEKEDQTSEEFAVPAKLKQLYLDKDYGQYGKDGILHTCFLTNHDITGGNSGSPVINAKGELIGLAFDGNWEAMSGDIAFEPELQRTICADIRYVLFVIDKYAGAHRLIEEMDIVKTRVQPAEKQKNTAQQIEAETEMK
ncbi:MAG: S46 family peptidase [Bacteroidota bacterium]|nr:S46 family peptidase [Bacteroidota bacterium]